MFISFKLNKKYLYLAVLAVAALVAAMLIIPRLSAKASVSANAGALGVKSEKDISSYLSSLGWVVGSSSDEFCEVIIPKEFDDVYRGYNELQKENGFDLSKFLGRRAKKYTFAIKSYPGEADGTVYANVIVYKEKIIGGDITCARLDGFMTGLKPASKISSGTAST